MIKEVGEIVKWPTTTDCKSVLSEFEGSNPSLPTTKKDQGTGLTDKLIG
jgi:hypothetical protein